MEERNAVQVEQDKIVRKKISEIASKQKRLPSEILVLHRQSSIDVQTLQFSRKLFLRIIIIICCDFEK
jgi:hypothetical protein